MPRYKILQLSQFSWVAKIVGALIINAQSVRWRRAVSLLYTRPISFAAVLWLQGDSNLRPRHLCSPNDENVENHPGHIANKVQFNFVEKLKTHGHLHIDKISFFFLTKISNSLYILWSNFVIEERADQNWNVNKECGNAIYLANIQQKNPI